MAAFHGLRPFVSGRKHPLITKHLLANVRCLVRTICNYGFYFRKPLYHFVIHFIKCNTVMDIAGSHDYFHHKTVFIAGGMGFVGKLALVVAFYKQTTVRVSDTFCDCALFLFLAARLLLLGCVIFAFLRCCRRIVLVIIKLSSLLRHHVEITCK